MQRQKLINDLLSADKAKERSRLLSLNLSIVDISLARKLKDTYYSSWTSAPQKTLNAAAALEKISSILKCDEADAFAKWVRGIADLTNGKIEKAIEDLDTAAQLFSKIGDGHNAAQTQIAKLIALAMLGRYAESVSTGEQALKVFASFGDNLAAGKIQKNIGNIMARQGKESEAKRYYLDARLRFVKAKDKSELAMCDNSLANSFAELNDFKNAEKHYALALENAKAAKMFVTEAEIEASLGNLERFRGRFAKALQYLERSRQKYFELKMPHQTAIADLEIADIYLDLNLSDEAIGLYKEVSRKLNRLKLRGEEARARANYGKAALLKQDPRTAKREFERSALIYVNENNPVGAADVRLAEASLELGRNDFQKALSLLSAAGRSLRKSENPRQKLLSEHLRGEALRNLGHLAKAKKILSTTYDDSIKAEQFGLAQACQNSLGDLALQKGDRKLAKRHFRKAIDLTERLRSLLSSEEFRMALSAGKLAPLDKLAKIYLEEGDLPQAFNLVEKARSRTLAESVAGEINVDRGNLPPGLERQVAQVHEELNWYYSRLNRAEENEFKTLQKEAVRRERQLSDLLLQTNSLDGIAKGTANKGKREILNELQARLERTEHGTKRLLIEYVILDGKISAFVVTGKSIDFFKDFADESEIHDLVEGLRFQLGSLRFGKEDLAAFIPELKRRADEYLRRLFEKLLGPVKGLIGNHKMVIVPAGVLNYVPFAALFDGVRYLVESREVISAPSSAVWLSLIQRKRRKLSNIVMMGFADERIPLVYEEIKHIGKIFKTSAPYTGTDASIENFGKAIRGSDILHIACHGQFRPDNPMYSSLQLADGNITVNDIRSMQARPSIVTLSACETGLNKIAMGEEIIGLARGFLSAGVSSLVLSLWNVNDTATARLMKEFYRELQRGYSVGASLRKAQLSFIRNGEHPFYWAPFITIGK